MTSDSILTGVHVWRGIGDSMDIAKNGGSPDYKTRLLQFLQEIGYRYEQPPPDDKQFTDILNEWMITAVKPVLGWDDKRLAALADQGSQGSQGIVRCYPYASRELKLLMSKMTVMVIVIDDSLEDDATYQKMGIFSHRLCMGEPQPRDTILPLYEECIRELSVYYGEDPVLRGMGISPFITFLEAASIEKRMVTIDETLRASPFDVGYGRLAAHHRQSGHKQQRLVSISLEKPAIKFPYFVRQKNGLAEAYVAAVFKAYRTQELPLTRYIKALPDINFTMEITNDVLSLHKENLQGEKCNLIDLLTQALCSEGLSVSGDNWTTDDTFNLLCNQLVDAFKRIDELLGLPAFEKMQDQEATVDDDPDKSIDMDIAKQWRGWRDGYISWHLESGRYKLDFLREYMETFRTSNVTVKPAGEYH